MVLLSVVMPMFEHLPQEQGSKLSGRPISTSLRKELLEHNLNT